MPAMGSDKRASVLPSWPNHTLAIEWAPALLPVTPKTLASPSLGSTTCGGLGGLNATRIVQ